MLLVGLWRGGLSGDTFVAVILPSFFGEIGVS